MIKGREVVLRNLLASALIGVFSASPAFAAGGTEEVLLGVKIDSNNLELTVATGGCTKKGDFSVEVNKGFTGKPPYLLTVRRIRPDDCKAMMSDGTVIRFSKEELGLSGIVEMTLTNKIGNTSQHR